MSFRGVYLPAEKRKHKKTNKRTRKRKNRAHPIVTFLKCFFFFSRRKTTFLAEDDISGGLRWSHSDRLLNAHRFCFLDLFIGSVDNGEKIIYFFFCRNLGQMLFFSPDTILAVLAILVNIFFIFFAFPGSGGHSYGGPCKWTFWFGLSVMENKFSWTDARNCHF
jgi:hypothetical protein